MAAVALAFGLWITFAGPADDWPARVALRVPRIAWSLGFSPDGRTFLTSGEGGITPWDARTGRKGTPWANQDGYFAVSGTYSPDGRTFAAAIHRHPRLVEIELIDADTGRVRATLATNHPSVYRLAFGPDGRTLRAFVGDGPRLKEVVAWDASTGEETSRRAVAPPMRASVAAISPDGRLLAFIPFGSASVELWDLEADRAIGRLSNPAAGAALSRGLAFDDDGRTLAVGRLDGAVDLWDAPGRKLVRSLAVHPGGHASMGIRFGPDGRTLASTGDDLGPTSMAGQAFEVFKSKLLGIARRSDPELVVVDLATGRRIARARTSLYPMYSPDGRTVVTRHDDLGLLLRDLPGRPD